MPIPDVKIDECYGIWFFEYKCKMVILSIYNTLFSLENNKKPLETFYFFTAYKVTLLILDLTGEKELLLSVKKKNSYLLQGILIKKE